MPLPRVTFTQEELQKEKDLLAEAKKAGAMESRFIAEHPGAKIEAVCIDKKRGTLINPRTFQPITAEDWVSGCKKRGVIAVIPNL